MRKSTLAIIAVLCLSMPLAAQDASTLVNQWRSAQDNLAAGNPETAYAIFDQLLQMQPGHNAFLLGRARASLAAGRARDAAADYAVLLRKFPGQTELRQEAAEADRQAGHAELAQILAVPPPVLDLRAASLATVLPPRARPLDQTWQPAKRTFFSGTIRTGVMYDSNANQGPASEIFSLGDFTVTLPGMGGKSTAAAYIGANFDVLHRLGDDSPWAVVADARLFVRANERLLLADNQTREWQWGRVGAGLRYARGDNFFEARLKAEIFDYQLTNNVTAFDPELTYIRALNPRVHLISQAAGDVRMFKRDSQRNSFFAQAGEFMRIFFAEGRHSLLFGGKYQGNYAQLRRHSYQGFELMARLNLGVTDRLQLSPSVGFTREIYRARLIVLDAAARRDNRLRFALDVSYRVNERLSLEANFQYVKNNSRSFIHDYTQRVAGGGVAWSF